MKTTSFQLPNSPPGLLGLALLFWGWQCSFLIFAVVMAALAEYASAGQWRWRVTDKEFNTLADFSGVLFFVCVVYIFTDKGAQGIFVILSVLPFILYPLLLVQRFSETGIMKLSALVVSLRRERAFPGNEAATSIDISLPFMVVCLLAASAGNQRHIWFYLCVSLILCILLWRIRPPRGNSALWALLLLVALGSGFATQKGLAMLQANMEASFLRVFDQFMWRYRDPNRATTAIGSLGRLKLSDRIVLRLEAEQTEEIPILLREASYNSFGHGVWTNQESGFTVIDQNQDSSWTLQQRSEEYRSLRIATYMLREKGVIPLPHGSQRIDNVTAIEIEKNPQGTVMMDIREGWIEYDVEYAQTSLRDAPPDKHDLSLMDYHQTLLSPLIQELGIRSLADDQALQRVKTFFAGDFRYSLDRRKRFPRGNYLEDFLYESKQGHCEYFATATTLMLRAAGIPARYVVGYSVDEYSALEGQYIARARHAHSWVQAYVDGRWQVVDTTPAIWAVSEAEESSALQPFMDIWAWISFTWARWQSDDLEDEGVGSTVLLWLLVPLVLILAWRLYAQERVKLGNDETEIDSAGTLPGTQSDFYKLYDSLEHQGYGRDPGETTQQWSLRLQQLLGLDIRELVTLHYQNRFDPDCSSDELDQKIARLVQDFMANKEQWSAQVG